MMRSAVAGAALVVALTLPAFLLVLPRSAPIQHPDSGKARERPVSSPREMPLIPAMPSASGSGLPLPDAKAGAWTIIGDVLHENGTPIVGAQVTLRTAGGGPMEARTGAAGGFSLSILGVELDTKVALDIIAPGRANMLLVGHGGSLSEPDDAGVVMDLGSLVLGPSHTLSVVLRGSSGEPVEAERVVVHPYFHFRAHPDGSWEEREREIPFAGSPGLHGMTALAGGKYRINVEAEGHAPFETDVWLPRPEPLEVNLSRGLTIAGMVTGTDDIPVPDAQVRVDLSEGTPSCRREIDTGPDGRFVVHRLPEGVFVIMVAADGFKSRELERIPAGTMDLVLPLLPAEPASAPVAMEEAPSGLEDREPEEDFREQAGTLKATVVDESGLAIARAVGFTGFGWTTRSFMTSREGIFVAHLDPGTNVFDLRAEGFVRRTVAVTVEPGRTSEVQVVLERGGTITGRLLCGGEPYPGGRVSAFVGENPGEEDVAAAESVGDGRFILRGLPAGTYSVMGKVQWVAPGVKAGIAVGSRQTINVGDLSLEAQPREEVSGRVLDEEGRALAGAWVYVEENVFDDTRTVGSISDLEGRFSLEGMPGDECRVYVRKPGFYYPSQVIVAPATGLDLVLKRLRRVRGRTIDATTGLPVPGATVFVVDNDGGSGWFERTASDAEGRFRFGVYTYRDEIRHLAVDAEGYAITPIRVADREESEELIVPLHTGTEFRATILGESGEPLPEAAICLAQPDGCLRADLKTDSAGMVTCPRVREGPYRVYIHHEVHGAEVVSVEVRDRLAVPALILRGSGALTVRVLNGSGEPARKAEIMILDEEGEDRFDLMRALGESGIIAELVLNGRRTYHRLPRGRYRLRAKEWVGDGPFGPEVAVDLGWEPAEVTLTLP